MRGPWGGSHPNKGSFLIIINEIFLKGIFYAFEKDFVFFWFFLASRRSLRNYGIEGGTFGTGRNPEEIFYWGFFHEKLLILDFFEETNENLQIYKENYEPLLLLEEK